MPLLHQLQAIPGPSGDEGAVADFVAERCAAIPGVGVSRAGDLVVAVRGKPRVALFAHLDTVGFTLGYQRSLIPIGAPHVDGGECVREVGGEGRGRVKVTMKGETPRWRLSGKDGDPGSRWVYADPLATKKDTVSGPYLDNRAGVWNALEVLAHCGDAAAVFTPGEEHSGRGALVGARLVHEELGIRRALISDITWHTASIRCGKGPVVSLRDRYVPRQRFLEEVLAIAADSGVPFQREVESAGGSDGSWIERSTFPIDWVFVGAPQKRSHTARESCRISDLQDMVRLHCALLEGLSRTPSPPPERAARGRRRSEASG